MRTIYFFIGTEAELMKMYIVIRKVREQGFICQLISSGQNDITKSPFLELAGCNVDLDFCAYKPKNKGGKEYLKWLWKTEQYGVNFFRKLLREKKFDAEPIMVVHGDTLSTLLGARIAQKSKMHYVHVEGGLRSYNWLVPFPEEIDRYFSSKHADIIFCPKMEYVRTAQKYFKGEAVNTYYNTGIEILQYALKQRKDTYRRLIDEKYYVLAIHRQENLTNKFFMTQIVKCAIELSKKIKCLFIYHEQTETALKKYNLWNEITKCQDIISVRRLPYIDFIQAVDSAEFIIADGAGNQQEFYYMGKPYLIMRTDYEKESEGIGINAIGFDNDFNKVKGFYEIYNNYQHETIQQKYSPSDVIADKLAERYLI